LSIGFAGIATPPSMNALREISWRAFCEKSRGLLALNSTFWQKKLRRRKNFFHHVA
jgi:hypothetical protein